MKLKLIWLLILPMILSCHQNSKTSERKKDESSSLPSLPQNIRNEIFRECDYVDYIFYDLPFSISQDTEEAVKSNIRFISDQPVNDISVCLKPMARIIFQAQGEIIGEADLFFSESCTFFVFMDGNNPIYANQLTTQAIGFYQNLIKQVTNSPINQ